MTVKRVAVVGASGHLGHIIASALLDTHEVEVVLLTTHSPIRHSTVHTSPSHRKEQLLAELVSRGARCETLHFDDTPAMHQALENVECVISCLGGPHFETMQRHLIDVLLSLPKLRYFFPAEFGAPPPSFIQQAIQSKNLGDRRADDPNDEVRQQLERYGPRLAAVWRTQRRLRSQPSPPFQTVYVYCGLLMDATLWPWFGIDVRHGRAQLVGDGRANVSWTHRADVARIVSALVTEKVPLPQGAPHVEVRIAAESLPLNDVIRRYEYVQNRMWQVSHVPVSKVWPFMRAGRPEHEPYDTELYETRALHEPLVYGSVDPDTLALRLLAAEGYMDVPGTGQLDNDIFEKVPHSIEVGLRAAVPKSTDWDFVTMQEKTGKPFYAGTKGFITVTAWIQEQLQLVG